MKTTASIAALSFAIALPLQASAEEYTFGIVPQQSASRLAQMWGPLLAEIGAQTGATFRFMTTKDIPTFEACLAAGAYDFAYMNPMHFAIFSEEAGYQALAHQDQKRLKGLMVVHKDSAHTGLESLANENLAFPSPGAFGASILNRASLAEADVPFTPNYVNSHDSVYRAVASGIMAAGGGVTRTFNAVDPEIRDQLRVIYETDGFTPHAFAAHESVASETAKEVQDVLVNAITSTPDLVAGIGMAGIVPAENTAWDDVRALNMKRSDTGISKAGDVACPSG